MKKRQTRKTEILKASRKKEILKARAKALARETEREEETQTSVEIVEFILANGRYAIESAYVEKVSRLEELAPLPCTPPFVVGIIDVGGQILSIIDIKKFFDFQEKGLGDLTKFIIVRAGEIVLGILADVVLGSRSIPENQILRSLTTVVNIREEYLRGVTKEDLVVLDVEKILTDKRFIVHEEVAV